LANALTQTRLVLYLTRPDVNILGEACPYHDTPLVDDGVTAPFWASTANIVASEYLRVLCLKYTVGSTGLASVVTHECQRYMAASAFTYVGLDESCPPSDGDACKAAHDGQWRCSNNVPGGIYKWGRSCCDGQKRETRSHVCLPCFAGARAAQPA
jgi:hypothetical protein